MKFAKITLSTLAVLGVIAVGGSYFTGQMAEDKYQAIITQANEELKQNGNKDLQARIENVTFTRGFFSSEVKYDAVAQVNGETFVLHGNDTLFHGPFPLNRLKYGNILPVMASIENHLSAPTQWQDKAEVKAANGVVLSGESEVSYAGNISGDYRFIPMQFTLKDGDVVHLSEGRIKASENAQEVNIAKINIEGRYSNNHFLLEEVAYQNTAKPHADYPHLTEAKATFNVRNASYSESEKAEKLRFHDLSFVGNSQVNQDRFKLNGELSTQMSLHTQQGEAQWGKQHLKAQYDFSAQTLNELAGKIQQHTDFIETQQGKALAEMLLSQSPKINLEMALTDHGKGNISSKLALDLKNFDIHNLRGTKALLDIFNPSTLEINVDLESLEKTIANTLKVSDKAEQREKAEQLAKEQVAGIVAQARQTGDYLQVNDKAIAFTLGISNGIVTVNGKERSQSEIETTLFMLALGASSLMR